MVKALFIDRDGVVNDDTGRYYTYTPNDFVFCEKIEESLKLFKQNDFLTILITNQGGVAKGEYSRVDVEKTHRFMQEHLKKYNAEFTDIYYCPHHDKITDCRCRKPKSGMIIDAIEKYNIDISKSVFIGDSKRDIQAAQNAGIYNTYKIKKNSSIFNLTKSILNID